jgi:hypothetical protein
MTAELIYMRDDGSATGYMELTSSDDPKAVAYIRADLAGNISMREKRDLFAPGAECEPDFKVPCKECLHHHTDELEYPCAACKHC